jgi:hypothetical protein
MKKGPEVPDFESRESTSVHKESGPESLAPSGNAQKERSNALRKINEIRQKEAELGGKEQIKLEKELGVDLLREDFITRAEQFPKTYNKVDVEVGGETYFMSFTGFQKSGKSVDKTADLVREVKGENRDGKKLRLGAIDGEFTLTGTKSGQKGLDMKCTIPVTRILTCQSPGMLKRLLTETFGGADAYYGRLAGEKQKEKSKNVTASPQKNGMIESKTDADKEAVIARIKKAAEAKEGETSIISRDAFISASIRIGDKKQLRLTSADMAVWNVAVISDGTTLSTGRTENPEEFIRLQEAEPG